MPITPYTTPVQFEYKPLNLAAFAVPLGKMQEQFDLMKATVSSTDFDLSHLPYGTDPEKAKELIATAQEKRDELAKSLLETKNYKQAAIKLMELNKAWKLDPEKQALESNYALWKKRDDEERARIDSGKPNQIKRDQYLQWRSDEIAKYEEAGGAGFKASYERPEGEYKKITGDTGRLGDLEDELQKLSFQVAGAVSGDKRESALRMIGIDPTTLDARFQKSIVEERDATKVTQAVRNYLLTQPKYQDWAKEVAHYDHIDMIRSGNYDQYASQIVDRTLSSTDDTIKQREAQLKKSKIKKEDDDVYNNLLERKKVLNEMKTTGQYDPKIVEGLYTTQRLQETFDFTALGNVFEYRKTSTEDMFRDIDGGGGGAKKTGLGEEAFYSPETDVKVNIGGFQTQVKNASSKLINPLKQLNGFAQGNVRAAIFDGLSADEAAKLRKNFGAQMARNRALFTAFETSSSVKDFVQKAKNNGITLTEGRASTLFKAWNAPDGRGRKQFAQTLESARNGEEEYNSAKENLNTLRSQISKNEDWKTNLKTIGSATFSPKQVGDGKDMRYQRSKLFYSQNYTESEYKKAGIAPKDKWEKLTFAEVAKLNGYKNLEEAIFAGFDFAGAVPFKYNFLGIGTAVNIETKGFTIQANPVKKFFTDLQNQIVSQAPTHEMAYNLLNTPQITQDLSQMVTTVGELMQHQPAYKASWNNVPGFTEDGRLKEGTKLMTDAVHKPVLHIGGDNKLYYKYYYEYEDDEGVKQIGSAVVKPKAGMDVKNIQLLDDALYTANTGRQTEVNKNVKDMLLVNKFDAVYPNSLNQSTFDGIIVKEGQKKNLGSIPLPGQNQSLIFRKEKSVGSMAPVVKLYHKDGNTGKEEAVKNAEGKVFIASDITEAKRFAAAGLVDVE
jgi:hypothetical protein